MLAVNAAIRLRKVQAAASGSASSFTQLAMADHRLAEHRRWWSSDRIDRRVDGTRSRGRTLAGPPEAVHARHDHRAARPVFLDIGRGAIPHRIRAGIVARIDAVGLALIARIDRHAPRRPRGAARTASVGTAAPPAPVRMPDGAVCACALAPLPANIARQSGRYRRRPDPHHTPTQTCCRPQRSPIAAPRSTARRARKTSMRIGRGTRAKQTRCGHQQKRPRWPKWRPWRTRSSSACRGLSRPVRGRDHPRRRFSDRRGARRDAGARANSTCSACSRASACRSAATTTSPGCPT